MTIFDYLFVIIFAILYPAYIFYRDRKIKQDLIDNKPGLRKRDYQLTSFWLLSLGITGIILWIFRDRPLEKLGIDFSALWTISISILFALILIIYFFSMMKTIRGNSEERNSLKDKLKGTEAVEYLPRNVSEFKWFILLSVSAGISEELIFRGYLFWVFESFDSIIITIVASSILFGLAHSYQGWNGIIKTGSMGLIMAIIYVLTDSLWIPIFLHIFGDIYGGVMGLLAFEDDKD